MNSPARARLRQNIGFGLFQQASNYLVPVLVFPLITPILGVHGMGMYAMMIAGGQIIAVFCEYGFSQAALALAGHHPNDIKLRSQLAQSILKLKIFIFFPIAILVSLGLVFLTPVGWLGALSAVILGLCTVFQHEWVFYAAESLRSYAWWTVLTRWLILPVTWVSLYFFPTASAAALSYACCYALWSIGAWMMALTIGLIHRTNEKNETQEKLLIQHGWSIFIQSISYNLTLVSAPLIMGAILGPTASGLYIAAERIKNAALAISSPLTTLFLSRLSSKRADLNAFRKELKRGLYLQLGLGVIAALGMTLFAKVIILLLFGTAFAPAIHYLQAFAVLPVMAALVNVFGTQFLVATHHGRYCAIIMFCSLVIHLTLFPLSVILWGIWGGICSVIFVEFFIFCASMLVFNHVSRQFFNPQTGPVK